MKRTLILQVPVIHKGYLDLFDNYRDQISEILILKNDLVEKLSDVKTDIASISSKKIQELLIALNYPNVRVVGDDEIKSIENSKLFLINDEIGRNLKKKYFADSDIKFINVFLRWDRDKVFSEENLDVETSDNKFDQEMMKLAYSEAEKSGDWWRQVGAVLVKNKKNIMKTHNTAMPSEHIGYQCGAVRDLMKVGEKPEFTNYAHAEQVLIAKAANEGIRLKDTQLYITHFPCPVCAKLLALSGINKIYFAEGSSVLLGKEILESREVKIKRIIL